MKSDNGAKLIEIARLYLNDDPKIYFDDVPMAINDDHLKKIQFDPAWFTAHDPGGITYEAPNKYKAPYDYLNDKCTVDWLFMPGCEERPNDTEDDPNWFTPDGIPCGGGYGVDVLINRDMYPDQIRIVTLK